MKIKSLLLESQLAELVFKQNKIQKKTRCGYGACAVSGCNCRAYEGRDNTCGNCGHNYERHW
jgi:hypothetical protein